MAGLFSSGLTKVAGNFAAAAIGNIGMPKKIPAFADVEFGLGSKGRNKTKNLAYPLNVESDPSQGHYIIFEIMEQDKAKLKARKAAVDAAQVAVKAAKEIGTTSEDATGFSNTGPGGQSGQKEKAYPANKGNKQSGPNSLTVAQDAVTAMPTCIALYMPPSVQVSYGAKYGETEIGVMAETVNAGIQAFMNTGGGLKNQAKAVGGEAWEGLKAGAAGALKATADTAAKGSSAVFAINTGSIITPRMELMFEGITRRTFSFNFTFLPKSEEEAEIVEQIVFQFKYHMASNYGGLGGGADGVRAMEIPDFFNIRYMFGGEDGDLGPKKENMHLNLIKQCVLTSTGIEYGSDRYKSYAGGRPQTTKLSLSFQELEIITKDYIKQGY